MSEAMEVEAPDIEACIVERVAPRFAIEPVARMYGLSFLPVAPEEYDFLVVERSRGRPGVKAFLDALRDPKTRDRISALGMQPAR